MTTYIPTFPAACFKPLPTPEEVLYGKPEPVTEFTMPILAIKLAKMATEETLSPLLAYVQELSKQYPMAIVIFISAVATQEKHAAFYSCNRDYMSVAAKLGKYF